MILLDLDDESKSSSPDLEEPRPKSNRQIQVTNAVNINI